MKGKDTFTRYEVEQIKALIAKKCISSSPKQKKIRREIRKIGFYYSDYSTKKNGYSVGYFESLILSKQIKVI